MKMLMSGLVGGLLVSVAAFGSAQAQSPMGAEARLKEKNITLPPEAEPVANYVNWVRVGNLLFMAGNTPGAQWTLPGAPAGALLQAPSWWRRISRSITRSS